MIVKAAGRSQWKIRFDGQDIIDDVTYSSRQLLLVREDNARPDENKAKPNIVVEPKQTATTATAITQESLFDSSSDGDNGEQNSFASSGNNSGPDSNASNNNEQATAEEEFGHNVNQANNKENEDFDRLVHDQQRTDFDFSAFAELNRSAEFKNAWKDLTKKERRGARDMLHKATKKRFVDEKRVIEVFDKTTNKSYQWE